ncbi:hypothetical protein MTO96_043208 [Rhipicephalus appendiculatus]
MLCDPGPLIRRLFPRSSSCTARNTRELCVLTFGALVAGWWCTSDDLLPTSEDRLIYSRCSDPREFWVALLEKAYAK